MNKILINDDFDLKKIQESGQCFRIKTIDNNIYRFISGDKVLYLKGKQPYFKYETFNSDWSFWSEYFDLSRNYNQIRNEIVGKNSYIDKAIDFSKGIRILKQDPYENLMSFILAQRKSIPSIINCVNKISEKLGHPIITPYEIVYTFPTIEELIDIDINDLKELKLGYRAKYFYSALESIRENKINFNALSDYPTSELINYLKGFYGVGDKIANCIALFSYNRLEAVPIDIWISRSIKNNFNSINPFNDYEEFAGLAQQYLFYYERNKLK